MNWKNILGFVVTLLWAPLFCRGGNYTNFAVAVYIPVNIVHSFEDPGVLSNQWDTISRQLKVDKVYIEVQRNRQTNGDALLNHVKQFFLDRGVRVAGGMALSDGGVGGQFRSFCYTDPRDRAFIQSAAQLAARHFDEIIQDDFFFTTTKNDSDIAAKGERTWEAYRLAVMDDAAENLIVKPARAINPRIKVVIKFPNWYEHFQGLGYDLDREPQLFDGIYTGTETRDPAITDQHLQQYESYEIFRYFENVAPGRNGGGWVDTYSLRYIDRYAGQLWDTLFAKAPEITLFEWSALTQPFDAGDRAKWQGSNTSFNLSRATNNISTPTWASIANYSLRQVDAFLGKLGNPIGIASYKPYQSSGEDYLQNYLGMVGIPIEMYPYFPTNAAMVLLTGQAKFDPDIVGKIKAQLRAGRSVVITSGLLRALQDNGLTDIANIRWTDRKFLAHQYAGGYGAGNFSTLDGETNSDVLFPEIDFLTNDSWALVRAEANGNGFPLLLMNRYSKGVLYVWTMPDNFTDLYALPPEVTAAVKSYIMRGFPVRVDGPARVALLAYDNGTFIVHNYSDAAADVKISTLGNATRLKNLVTGETLDGRSPPSGDGWNRRNESVENRISFKAHLPPHSYMAFALENTRENASASDR
ncbi:MAG TPA: hypothetical protein VGY56_01135 [Verrucomicrobiae bacterium]|nr:hypothetical protein [Verrucomicrobiae bacterium]